MAKTTRELNIEDINSSEYIKQITKDEKAIREVSKNFAPEDIEKYINFIAEELQYFVEENQRLVVCDERAFMEEKTIDEEVIYIVCTFATTDVYYSTLALPVNLTAYSTSNKLESARKILLRLSQVFNYIKAKNIKQIWETPSVITNFEEIGSGFGAVVEVNGTLQILSELITYDVYYKDEPVYYLTRSFSSNTTADTQPKLSNNTISVGSLNSNTFAISTFALNNKLINDVLESKLIGDTNRRFEFKFVFSNGLEQVLDMVCINFEFGGNIADIELCSIGFMC